METAILITTKCSMDQMEAERFGFALAMMPLLREGRALLSDGNAASASDVSHFLRRLEQRVEDICGAGLHRIDDSSDEPLAAVPAALACLKAHDVESVGAVQIA